MPIHFSIKFSEMSEKYYFSLSEVHLNISSGEPSIMGTVQVMKWQNTNGHEGGVEKEQSNLHLTLFSANQKIHGPKDTQHLEQRLH